MTTGETLDFETECKRLRAETARLAALLERYGIPCSAVATEATPAQPTLQPGPTTSPLSSEEKVALFRRLFRGRTDVYLVRWESKAGKSGYCG